MSNFVEIEIVGKNYEKLLDASFDILNSDSIDESIVKYIKDNQVIIIEKFLEKMDKKGIINTAIGFSKKNEEKSLWTPNYNGSSYFGGVVGVIEDELLLQLENYSQYTNWLAAKSLFLKVRLQIKSRFDIVKPYFLATMLLRNNIKLNDNMVLSSEDDLYDYMLLFWYKTKLQEAFTKGFYKTYRRFEADNERLKGAIDIARHIRLNIGQNNGKIAYSYRENTINNYLNHLIVAAYDYLKKKYPELVELNFDNNPDMKGMIEGIKCEIRYNDIESKKLISRNNKPISHPYFMEYEDLRVICIKILRDEGISIWDAENEKTKSILFYIPDLWELFLEDKLKERCGDDVLAQGRTPNGDTAIMIFGDLTGEQSKNFTKATYPDYIFFDEKDPYMVLDAKFRKGWEESILKSQKSKIYDLDDYDKCIRDMNSVNVHATGIIFPTNILPSDDLQGYFREECISHKISSYNDWSRFFTFPISVPKADENMKYTDWKREFDQCVDKALSNIESKVKSEKEFAKAVREYLKKSPFPQRENIKN